MFQMNGGLFNEVLLVLFILNKFCSCSFTMIEVKSGTEIEETLQ